MSPTDYQRDFTFEEWQGLPEETRTLVRHDYWNPFEPELGRATREAILAAFEAAHPEIAAKALSIGYGHFQSWVEAIYVVVPEGSIRVPRRFASLLINKGVQVGTVDDETILVRWREVGGTNCPHKPNRRPQRRRTGRD